MPRKPNYAFERHERDRAKAAKLALKADAKRELRERKRALAEGDAPVDATDDGSDDASGATPRPDEA